MVVFSISSLLITFAVLGLTVLSSCGEAARTSNTCELFVEKACESQELSIPEIPAQFEPYLSIRYQLDCSQASENSIRKVSGSVSVGLGTVDQRWVRFDLYSGNTLTEVGLAGVQSNAKEKIVFESHEGCVLQATYQVQTEDLSSITAETVQKEGGLPAVQDDFLKKIALKYSPFLVIREDQVSNRNTDIPLISSFHVKEQTSEKLTLVYTVFFTDEDSMGSTHAAEAQLTRYGRSTDVEYDYEITLNSQLEVKEEIFQGFLHFPNRFDSSDRKYIGSSHPILFNVANNNIFNQVAGSLIQRSTPQIGHHLIPRRRIHSPDAREWAMFKNPWIFRASYEELKLERKPLSKPEEYLYMLFTGTNPEKLLFFSGSFVPQVDYRAADGSSSGTFISGNGASEAGKAIGNIASLGEDMWDRQSFSAIRMNSSMIESVFKGTGRVSVSLLDYSILGMFNVRISQVQLIRLVPQGDSYTYELLEGGGRCQFGNPSQTKCEFGSL